jgi:hypothetical protein
MALLGDVTLRGFINPSFLPVKQMGAHKKLRTKYGIGIWPVGIWRVGIWPVGIWPVGIWRVGIWPEGIWPVGYITHND